MPAVGSRRFCSVEDAIDREVGFEELFARADDDLGAVPWASLAGRPALIGWLEDSPEPSGLTAFDVAPTAIARCRQRFPDSNVSYRVADLFALPEAWRAAFDLVVENRTLQSLPVDQRAGAARAIAGAARTGGRAWVRCLARDEPLAGGPGRSFTAIYERAGSSAPWTARS